MFVLPALKRPNDPRSSGTGFLSYGQKPVRTVNVANARVPKRNRYSHRGSVSLSGHEVWPDETRVHGNSTFSYSACLPGDVSLAPLTAGTVVDLVCKAAKEEKPPLLSVAMFQYDQYRLMIERKLAAKINLSQPDEPKTNTVSTAKLPGSVAKAYVPVLLPQRSYIPGPIKNGQIFKDTDNISQAHKLYKTGWIKLSGRRA